MEFTNHPTVTSVLDVPVLIAGAGPAGLVTAIGLARQGIRPLVVERHPSTSIFPRATGVSTRSMEIFRSWGIDDEVRRGGWKVVPRQATVRRLDDPHPVEAPLGFPDEAASLAVSPATAAVSPQDHLEPVLLEHLRALGGEVRFSTQLAGFQQDADGVDAILTDRSTGAPTHVRARYLVGADGHRSAVRSGSGIAMEGPDDLGSYLSVLFRADLSSVLGERRYGLYAIEGPAGPPTILVPSGVDDRFVLGVPLPPGVDDEAVAAMFPSDRCIELVRAAAGRPDLPVEILATSTFSFAAQVASRMRDGHVFLVGDAAHRMTPRGGRGMNTAIADGEDLAWKLAWVLRRLAGPALLDTYEAERMPIGRRNVALSMSPGGGGTDDGLVEDLGPLDGRIGARLPHAWLDDEGVRRSTRDLAGTGVLLLSRPVWASMPDGAMAVPFRHVTTADPGVAAACRLGESGAVLVRPDGVVVARWEQPPASPVGAVCDAIREALAVEPVPSAWTAGLIREVA